MGRLFLAVAVATVLIGAGLAIQPAYAGCNSCDKPSCDKCHHEDKCCNDGGGEFHGLQDMVKGFGDHHPISVDCCKRDCFKLLCCQQGEFELLCPKCKRCADKCSCAKPKCGKCKQDTCTTCKPKCNKCHQDTCTTCKPKCNKCKQDTCTTCKPKCNKCKQDTCTTCKPKCEKCHQDTCTTCKPKCEKCHQDTCSTCKPKCSKCG